MKKVMIIGAGGIGSHLIPCLARTNNYELSVFDPDKVELKNVTYQNFNRSELEEYKSDCMGRRYENVGSNPYLVLTKKQVMGYDLVICCADNLSVRQMLYKTDVPWLDLRAQGRNGLLVSYQENPKNLAMLNVGPDGSFSCQGNDWDGNTDGIHFTHVAIAGMGAQWVQRYFAGDSVKTNIQLSI